MAAISDNLMHFLGREFRDSPSIQIDIFKSIIEQGLRCGKVQIKFSTGGTIHNRVVCFSDIPLSECDEHTAIYGKFGIGFKKSFVKRNGGNPARYFVDYLPGETIDEKYIENRGLLYLNICSHFNLVKKLVDLAKNKSFALYDSDGNIIFSNKVIQEWLNQQISILSFEKETGDLGPARDETKEIDLYYKEREWRLVPMTANIISGSVEKDNDDFLYYKFQRNDLNVVVTPNDEVRTHILEYFLGFTNSDDARLRAFAKNPLPIITYDDLRKW